MLRYPSRSVWVTVILLFAGLAVLPLFGDTYMTKLGMRMIVFAIFALSLDLLVGFTGLVSFGHAAFFGLAAYSLQMVSPEDDAVNLLTALPLSLGITALAGLVIGIFVIRTRGIYFIMVTLAFAQMLYHLFHDTSIAGGSDGAYIWYKPSLRIGDTVLLDFDNRAVLYYSALALLLGCFFLLTVILHSPFGKVLQGIRVNTERMQALGFATDRFKLAAFVISATMAGLAGFLFACIDGYVSPGLLSWHESGTVLVMLILGGIGTLYGAILGAVALLGVEEVFRNRALLGPLVDHWQILLGCFVIIVVLFLQNGLAGVGSLVASALQKKREPDA